jgi:hypothetical protein
MASFPVRPPRSRSARAVLVALALAVTLPVSAIGAQGHPHPATSFVNVLAAGGLAVPLINSGDTFDGVTLPGIPDGIGIAPVGNGKAQIDLFVTFEQSHVPFQGFADYEDSSVQRLRLDLKTQQIIDLKTMLPASAGLIRFCSATMVGPNEGFGSYTFLANEESNDVLDVPSGAPYQADGFLAPYRQAGYSVWVDAKTGDYKVIAGAGRMNHENLVVVPGGWPDVVSFTGDDTFSAGTSQLFQYQASSPGAFKQDRGSLWAFRVTSKNGTPVTPTDAFNGANDYLDIVLGDTMTGEFIPVPADYANGTHGGTPQTDLETWSNANNVFQFIRVEDLAYNPNDPLEVYFADTGSSVAPDLTTGRMTTVGGTAQNGRIFKLVMDATDPTVVDAFTVLADGNDAASAFTRPDNIGTSAAGMMVQEDSSSANDIWWHPWGGGWTKVATTNQGGSAETSGIVDASEWLGDGWWVFDVQSHTTQHVFSTNGSYTVPISNTVISGFTIRRELGQLLLLYIPGS